MAKLATEVDVRPRTTKSLRQRIPRWRWPAAVLVGLIFAQLVPAWRGHSEHLFAASLVAGSGVLVQIAWSIAIDAGDHNARWISRIQLHISEPDGTSKTISAS